jgi:hypothetical protein
MDMVDEFVMRSQDDDVHDYTRYPPPMYAATASCPSSYRLPLLVHYSIAQE